MEGERAEEGYSAVAQSERDAMAGAPAANVWTKAAGLSGRESPPFILLL